jgi:plasmid stability protein
MEGPPMASITIKNVPDDLHRRLKEQAERNHRSLNGEIIACLERQVESPPRDPEKILERLARLREEAGVYVTEEQVQRFKEEGRP